MKYREDLPAQSEGFLLTLRGVLVKQRLQKYMAACGVSSRRGAEQMINAGHVMVNGNVVTEQGLQIDPSVDLVMVDGKLLNGPEAKVYYALHKPLGVVSTVRDEHGRTTVRNLLADVKTRVYPVGRLDADSEGLLLLTNDGKLAARLTHPRHNVPKKYLVWVSGQPAAKTLAQLRNGVKLEDGPTRPAQVRLLQTGKNSTKLEITLQEGRNRQIRRMCKAVGHPVLRLCRISIGSLVLGDLPAGCYRQLTSVEVESLKSAVTTDLPDLHGSKKS